MNDLLAGFCVFALTVFGACCVYVAYSIGSNMVGAIYYRSIRSEIRAAIEQVGEGWEGEALPAETVQEILVLLHSRRVCIPWNELRERQGGGA